MKDEKDKGIVEDPNVDAPIVDAAPVEDKPIETVEENLEELPKEEDVSNLLALLNEIDSDTGGEGGITEVPPTLINAVRGLADKLVSAINVFEDPIIKDILLDMIDQQEDGAQPDAILAINRVVPREDLDGIEGEENYDSLQEAVNGRIQSRVDEDAAKDVLLDNIDASMENLESYATNNGLDEERKSSLWDRVNKIRDAFADGLLTEDEFGLFDKGENYDTDMEVMRKKLPEEPKKVILPDSTSTPDKAYTKPTKPRNSIEAVGASMEPQSWEKMGKRK